MFTVAGILELLKLVGPVVAKAPAFVAVFNQIKDTFKEKDQATLQEAYRNLQEENTGGHERLQEMLRRASLEVPAGGHATDLAGKPIGG